ncbi:MAG: hypothetical protein AABO41_06455 [Acidobacteriota bacterium]
MRFYWLVIGILCVWRVTHLLHAEDGPWELLARLRGLAGSGFWASLLDCFYCLSIWVAVPFAFIMSEEWKERLLLWPALSAAAILLERVTLKESAPPPATYFEDEETEDVLLRKKESGVSNPD